MSSCIKICYSQRRDAQTALRIIARKCRRKGKKVPIAVYPCDLCGAWHLTSKKPTGRFGRWPQRSTSRPPGSAAA
jgi:hypothetical protein